MILIIHFYVEGMVECARESMNLNSCIVQSIAEVLASNPQVAGQTGFNAASMLRVQVARNIQHIMSHSVVDDWGYAYECETPSEEEIKEAVDSLIGMCCDVDFVEHQMVLDSFISIFMNQTCLCMY